jgi:hypothetical protein
MAKHKVKYNPQTQSTTVGELQPGESFITLPLKHDEDGEWPDHVYTVLSVNQPNIPSKSRILNPSHTPCTLQGKAGGYGNDGIIYQVDNCDACMRVTLEIEISPA